MSVYFAQVGPYIKVGYSADPIKRAGTLTTNTARPDDVAHGTPVDLIGWIAGDRRRERELHRRFADRWVEGEWFRLDVADARELIWADPWGIDMERMSAQAVIAARRYPDLTRDQLAAAGVRIEANPDPRAAIANLMARTEVGEVA